MERWPARCPLRSLPASSAGGSHWAGPFDRGAWHRATLLQLAVMGDQSGLFNSSVNSALDRLAAGFQMQRQFTQFAADTVQSAGLFSQCFALISIRLATRVRSQTVARCRLEGAAAARLLRVVLWSRTRGKGRAQRGHDRSSERSYCTGSRQDKRIEVGGLGGVRIAGNAVVLLRCATSATGRSPIRVPGH